ncbi:MAG: hypothetical protein KAS93_08220 [Gammaproteobacteria bacterium]|nr:hypothetical protein [Gammaproteobacteria bacterium]
MSIKKGLNVTAEQQNRKAELDLFHGKNAVVCPYFVTYPDLTFYKFQHDFFKSVALKNNMTFLELLRPIPKINIVAN